MLNERPTIQNSPKLSEVLFERKEHSFASLAALPSNVEAIEAADLRHVGGYALRLRGVSTVRVEQPAPTPARPAVRPAVRR